MLTERKDRLEGTILDLEKEQDSLKSHLKSVSYSDADIERIETFCEQIHKRLGMVTLDGKHRILGMLDVRGTLAIENEEKVVYVTCLIAPQQVSLVLTSHLSNIGATASLRRAFLPMVLSR
jgi:hypothetical protein